MALVLPRRGQADWDITNNNALLYLEGLINSSSGSIDGVTVTGIPSINDVITATSATTAHWAQPSGSGSLLAANNLSDLLSPPAARTNLGLGTAATASVSAFDAVGAATTAQANAEAYTDTQLFTEITRANNTYMAIRTDVFDVTRYGARGDGKIVLDGAITSGQGDLTSASNPFASSDINKWVMIKGAAPTGVTSLIAQITGFVNAGHVTISVNASTTVTGAMVLWATDDTASIQTAINNAIAYAALHGEATIFFPVSSGLFYGVAGNLVTAHSGNSQLYLPPVITTGNKSNIIFLGVANGSVLQHWEQLTPQFSGSTIVSFGVFASSVAQIASINAAGNASVFGGPTQMNGYGVGTTFSNMATTFKDMSVLTTYSANGLNYAAGDMSGISNCGLFDFAYGTTGTVPHNDFAGTSSFANGLSIGWLMPANGNNDNCAVRNVTCHGGFTFGFFATEHTVADNMRILYCWSGLCPVGNYLGSVGSTHALWINQISIEACSIEMNIVGIGSEGIGPFINIDQLDTETSTPIFTDRNSGGALNSALGTVRMTGLYNIDNLSVTAPTGLKIIDGQKAYPVRNITGAYSVKVTDDTLLSDATAAQLDATLISASWTPNSYTFKKTDSSANPVVIHTVNGELIYHNATGATTYTLVNPGDTVTLFPARVSSVWNWYTK